MDSYLADKIDFIVFAVSCWHGEGAFEDRITVARMLYDWLELLNGVYWADSNEETPIRRLNWSFQLIPFQESRMRTIEATD